MSEKFALKWKDYQSNWSKSLSELRRETDFADVTLISDDKVKFSAHKILLSSCSNTFKIILKESVTSIPLLYLGGISSDNLAYILDYIYHGEVNLFQEQLDSFLDSAQKLEIEGLMGNKIMKQETHHENTFEPKELEENKLQEEDELVRMDNKPVVRKKRTNKTFFSNVSKIDVTSLSPEEIEVQIKGLYKKIDGSWSCLSCDYTSSSGHSNIRRHVEIHLKGLSYICNLCDKEFGLKNSLNWHKSTVHK